MLSRSAIAGPISLPYIICRDFRWRARPRPAISLPCRAIGHQGKEYDMRDELDGRMWVDHHDGFGELVDNAAAALRAGLPPSLPPHRTSQHRPTLRSALSKPPH